MSATPEEAFAPRLGANGFFFGISAAWVHELPLPPRVRRIPVHVAVPVGRRRPSARDVAAHHVRIDPNDITIVRGMRVTTVERTWCDLAASGLTLGELVAVGDAILRITRPRSTPGRMHAAAARYESRRGTATIRAALPLLDGRADSAPESEIRIALISDGVTPPLVNAPLRVAGRTLHLDLAWPDARVAIEYEGDHHRTDRAQWHHDIRRYDLLVENGWTVIRATAADYRDARRLVAHVRRALP